MINAMRSAIRRLRGEIDPRIERSVRLREKLDGVTETLEEQVQAIDRVLSKAPDERYLIEETLFPPTPRRHRGRTERPHV